MSENDSTPSTWHLLNTMVGQASSLLGIELRLVRAEVGEKISATIRAIAFMVASFALGLGALVVLLQASVAALVMNGIAAPWAGLIVAVVTVVVAIVLMKRALALLKPSRLAPTRSLMQFSKDMNALKGVAE